MKQSTTFVAFDSIYIVLQLDNEIRNIGMKLFLEETFANYQKLIENSNVVAKKIKDKLTLVDVEGNISVSSTSSSTPINLDPI